MATVWQLNCYDRRSRVEPDDVEEKLQAWLDDNPDARIEQVAQTPLTGFDGETRRLLVTIFYRV